MGPDGNVRSVGVGLFLVGGGLGLCASCDVNLVVCRAVYICEYWLGAGESVFGWLHISSRARLVPSAWVVGRVARGAGRPGCVSDGGILVRLGRQFPCLYGWVCVCVGGLDDGGR